MAKQGVMWMAKDETNSASRRGVFKAGVAILAAGAAGAAFAKAEAAPVGAATVRTAQTKIAKAMLQYQDHPNGDNHCGICAQFEPPDQCKIVEGPISPNGWCAAFAPKGT
jgi:anaerobic selenocysteine-containing dehydrogenase